jgi:hypothetical protein
MSRGNILSIIAIIVLLVVVIIMWISGTSGVFAGLNDKSFDILLAVLLAIIAGLTIELIYKRFSPKSKALQTTMTHCPDGTNSFAQLILPNNNNIIVNGAERILGREDFLGIISTDKLMFIGKEHLKVIKDSGCFYIQDLNTKNGTMLNGEVLKGFEKVKLEDGDKIVLAKSLTIKYNERSHISQIE